LGGLRGLATALRGGAYNNTADHCRPACRNHDDPDNHDNDIGVRLVWSWAPHPGHRQVRKRGVITVAPPSGRGRNGPPMVSALTPAFGP
jgi:hypothetical protein